MLKMMKERSGNEQLKAAGQGASPSTRRGSRGSRGGSDFDQPAASGSSTQTPFGVQSEEVSGALGVGDGGMATGRGPTSRMQISKSGICNPSISEGGVEERADTHKHASTSWRCGFKWVSALLRSRLRAWDLEDAQGCECSLDDLYNDPFSFMYVEVKPYAVPHIIGRGGRVIRSIEQTCGVFLAFRDLVNGGHELCITGPRPACILAELAIELLGSGQHSVLITLSSLSL